MFVSCVALMVTLAFSSAQYPMPQGRCDFPILVAGRTWTVNVPDNHATSFRVRFVQSPKSVADADSGNACPFHIEGEDLTVEMGAAKPDSSGRKVIIEWKEDSFEETINGFEQQDASISSPQGLILFLGSSSIRGWNVKDSFPDLPTLNRGFGGSQYFEIAFYLERILKAHRPKAIVLYAGDNDIASGKSPEWVLADFQQVVSRIRQLLPETKLVILSPKPSIARWDSYPKMKRFTELASDWVRRDSMLTMVDTAKLLLDSDGNPRKNLYVKDGLHLSKEGYRVWSEAIRPLLVK